MNPDQKNGDKPIININKEIKSTKEKARSTAEKQLFVENSDREAAEFKEGIDSKYKVLSRIKQYKEVLAGEPESAEELITALQQATFEDLKRAEREKKYGIGVIGSAKAWLAGESDIIIKDNDIEEVNRVASLGRKALATFLNKKNIAAAGATIGIGILTGGVGFAATGVIAGSSIGRLTAEALTYGKEMGARKEVLLAEKEQWYELKRLAIEYSKSESTEDKTNIANQIVDIYHEQGESTIVKQLRGRKTDLGKIRESQDKLRHRLQIAGGIIGGGAGVANEVLSGKIGGVIDIDLWNKVDGQNLAHEVIKVDGEWHFLYTETEKLAGMGGGAESHVLGDPIWLGSNQADVALATTVQRSVPVLAAAWVGSIFADKTEDAIARKKDLNRINRNKEIADKLSAEAPAQRPEARKESDISEPSPEEEEDEENIRDLFEESKNPFPEVGQIWFKELSEEERERKGENGLNVGFFRIENIDLDNDQVTIANIDPELLIMDEQEEVIDTTKVKLSTLAKDETYSNKGRELAQGTQKQLGKGNETKVELGIDTDQPVVVPLDDDKANKFGIDKRRFGNRKPGVPVRIKKISSGYALVDILNPFSIFESREEEIIKEDIRIPIDILRNQESINSYWPDLEEEQNR